MFEINTATITIVLGTLVFLTNAIVEVFKMAFGLSGSARINKVALIVAIILTVGAYVAYVAYTGAFVVWYYFVGAIIAGFVVALIAMLGWDKVLSMYQEAQRK